MQRCVCGRQTRQLLVAAVHLLPVSPPDSATWQAAETGGRACAMEDRGGGKECPVSTSYDVERCQVPETRSKSVV